MTKLASKSRAKAAASENGEDSENGEGSGEHVVISAPRLLTAVFYVTGTTPYLQNRWMERAIQSMKGKQLAGSAQTKKNVGHAPRNFESDYEEATHFTTDGRYGIPSAAFRASMISACRLVGYKMTIAKLAIRIEADDFDRVDGAPLVYLEGKPERTEMLAPNANGSPDIRVRPMWREWSTTLRIQFDADIFSPMDIANLLYRAGQQIGIGAGRPDSKNSAGMGYGMFKFEIKVNPDGANTNSLRAGRNSR